MMHANTANRPIQRLLILVGNLLTVIGCAALIFLASGLISADAFFVGLAMAVRAVGSVAITGCLLSAIGYGIADYLDE